ncbi:MarR family winged helix-turn-helix transcriptional regulator [Streptomyces sp. P9(2023)]|uniref:MarR family winged helix-turn-helix transcriptional regulator n=1 Tax=Streptomyces sp. P9(2023) TaxID=3064394 RepID=UPI0028F436A1|nr:MarR family winged helix-turn-helix transcriptional regulator [Streptomyces sp. P9(2023)]MDT9691066.1 MarR family winged helix-turn-helix transcriptional regulator [Streptomyces sp. P9(2023)]
MGSRPPSAPVVGCGDLTEDFGFSLMAVAHAYRTAVSSVLGSVPQGARGYQTLAAVVEGDEPNQLALARYLRIDRTVMTYLIDELVAAGLVERRLDPADRRRRKIVATAHGIDTARELQRRVREAEDGLLSAIDEDDRELFRTLLRRVARSLGDVEPCDADTDRCDDAEPGQQSS